MGGGAVYIDSIIVPVSLFMTIGYHAYLWHHLKTRPCHTSIGINMLKRRSWLRSLIQGDDKKGMLVVQSLRNTLMFAILTATVTIIVTLCVAALTNNAFNAAPMLSAASDLFGSQSPRIMLLKYASATLFLLASFLCTSIAVAFLVDANFLVNAAAEFSAAPHTESVVERGFAMAVVGNRVLCMAFPLLMWLFGPLPVALSSAALVWALYHLDFVASLSTTVV